ncbi:LamG domain-containing protein [Ottowia thiooxydans]|uniref:LamG domain-containing protein n=1 Tax=Ottowia thiooxydans TaxID=219182 RepID=UPI00048E3D9D|nr:LamG domain-containing protein [Ottowia thiooxydans]
MGWVNVFRVRQLRWALVAMLSCGLLPAWGAINVIAHYSLGEADSGAANNAVVASGTQPTTGATTLPVIGAPQYSNAGAPQPRPSRLSVQFNGSTDGFRAPSVLTTASDNFGIEAWVRASSTAGSSQVVYNGDSSTSGGGIFRNGAYWGFLYGGQTLELTATPSVDLNTWTHLALVVSGGTSTLYKNGVAVHTYAGPPAVPDGAFSIGVGATSNGEFFAGNVDEVRVFTFAAGEFMTSDLLSGLAYTDPVAAPVVAPVAVPVNAPVWLLAMALALFAVGAAAVRSRR